MSEFVVGLKKSIKTGKTEQAGALLSTLPQCSAIEKEEALQALALASDKTALPLLEFLTQDKFRNSDIYPRLVQLIIDRAHLNYSFILILFSNTDEKTISGAVPLIRHILTSETDKELLNQIIREAGKYQLTALSNDIAEFIFYDDPLLKREAVKALERIATPHALEKLEKASKTEKCDQDILDAIDVLKTKKSPPAKEPAKQGPRKAGTDKTLEMLVSPDPRKRFEGINQITENSELVTNALSANLNIENRDLLHNLILAAGRTIPVGAVNSLFSLAGREKADPVIKFAVYDALSAFPELESAASILQGLSESAMFVRLAAVKALNRNLSDFVCAEIKAKIESGTKKGEILAQTILDARADQLIEYLMISDTFSYMASNYLTRNAPEGALDTFISILEMRRLRSTARKYKDIKNSKQIKNKAPLIIVSPSKSILDVYSKLVNDSGFPVLTFLHSQDAFETLVGEKPGAVICDMFLTEMTGFDLAGEVRELYSADQVPIVISTMQKKLDPDILKKEIQAAGIKTICDFPPKISQIKSWIK